MLRVIDYAYFQFENDIYVKRASGSFLADVVDFGANFAATISNGERAKTIINAALIAFRGGRKSASIHYFQEQTADVLITKMQTARNRELAGILKQMRDDDVDTYSLDAGLRDVIGYFYAGTLPRALQELKQDASISAKEAKETVRDIQLRIDKPIPGKLLTESRANFDLIRDLRRKLVVARNAGNNTKIAEITSTYEKLYNLVNNDPTLEPDVTALTQLKDSAGNNIVFISPVPTNTTGLTADCINAADRDFTEDVKNKARLKCADDYDTFLERINELLVSDDKYAKANEVFKTILDKFKETEK